MSPRLLLRRCYSVTASCLLAGYFAIALATPLQADEATVEAEQTNSTLFRRLFVPAEAPETWPIDGERLLPISGKEFARLIRKNAPKKDLGKNIQSQIPVRISHCVTRVKLLAGNVLRGTTEWTVELSGQESRLLSLSPLGLAVESASWRHDPTQQAQLGLWADPNRNGNNQLRPAVLVEQSGTLVMQWRLAARKVEAGHADFYLKKPIVVPQTLELDLPASHTAALSSAQLLQSDVGPQGDRHWVYQLAPRETHRLRIHRQDAKQAARPLPLVSLATSYQLEPSGLSVVTRLRLDARESRMAELKATLGLGLRVVDVRIDQQPVEWRVADPVADPLANPAANPVPEGLNDQSKSTLIISRPESLRPQAVEIRSLARLQPDTAVPWELPKLRFLGIAWTEGTTRLLVSPDLELRSLLPRQATLQHIVGVANPTREGEVFRLQEWSPNASVEIEVGRPQPRLSLQTLTSLELGRGEAQVSLVAVLTSAQSKAYQVQAAISPGWEIDSVTVTPKSKLTEWHVDRKANPPKLCIQLNRPVLQEKSLRLEIEAHETTGRSVLPATVEQLQLLRFQNSDLQREWLQLRTRKSEPFVLPSRFEQARLVPESLPETLPSALTAYLSANPGGTLLDVSALNAAEVLEFRQQPAQVEVDLQIEAEALPDSFKQSYRLDCHVETGMVSELVFEIETPLPETLQWTLATQRGVLQQGPVSMERLEMPAQPSSPGPERYLLQLPRAMTGDFRLQASYTQPAQPIERCNLLRLFRSNNDSNTDERTPDKAQSVDWQGQIALRGSLTDFKIIDQGWTPTAWSTQKAEQGQHPLLGVYQLGPALLQRQNASGGLRLQRETAATLVPPLIAWLAEYDTLQAANGVALHTARYSLENLGTSEAELVLPQGAQLQEAWLGNQPLDLKQLSSQGNTYQFRFGNEQRWPSLFLKYSTRNAPLGGSASIQPVMPRASFPVNRKRWTLWAPEQYEIDKSSHEDSSHYGSSQDMLGWKRLFGPLARSRGETVFNPLRGASWTELWSTPLEGQQAKQIAEKLAVDLAKQWEADPKLPLGTLLDTLAVASQSERLICVDRKALLAEGIEASSLGIQLIAKGRSTRAHSVQALPLTSYRLAFLVSPGNILLTTSERVAHWRDQLRPTETSGVFLVSSDDFAESLDKTRRSRSSDLLPLAKWTQLPVAKKTPWNRSDTTRLADVGRRAHTVDFVEGLPTLQVRRAYVQRSLWYAIVLLTLVVGVWQFAHFPNAMIFAAALAGVCCLTVPQEWLPIPQAVFLGLAAAAIVRLAGKSLQFSNERSRTVRTVIRTTPIVLLACLSWQNQLWGQMPNSPETPASSTMQNLPKVFIPIDAQGQQQGDEVYLPEKFLEKLRRASQEARPKNAKLVLLSANYSGSLPQEDLAQQTEPWTLRWKVQSTQPFCRLTLPLQRDEAHWDAKSHRLDGLPVELDWHPDDTGCSVTLPEAGIHWLELVVQPRIQAQAHQATVRLHLPPLMGAKLDLALAPNVAELNVPNAVRLPKVDSPNRWQGLLANRKTLDLHWTSKAASNHRATWERLEQLSWLHVDPATTRLDVQLSISGFQRNSRLLELKVSPQLRLAPPGEDSPIAEVIAPTPSQPTKLQLQLRPGLPPNFVIPLRFEMQRATSVGHLFFPSVQVQGKPPVQNLFAVSVSAGLTSAEQDSLDLRSVEPTEFSEYWSEDGNNSSGEPLYAYALEQALPDWSLRVWPDPKSYVAQQTVRVYCLPDEARVTFEAVVTELTGSWHTHRLQVPESLEIEAITVRDNLEANPTEAHKVPVRWSRVSATEVMIFLSRPLRHDHRIELQGHVIAAENHEFELPQIRLLHREPGKMHLDLFRAEEVQVHWADPQHAPEEMPGQRVPRDPEVLFVGHYSWQPTATGKISKIRLEKNEPVFHATSVTTLDSGPKGGTAQLNSRIQIQQGVVTRLTLAVPKSFQKPYVLQPEQVGVIDETRETPNGREITVLLAQAATPGDDIEVQLRGNLSLPVDQRLVVPALHWNDAAQQQRYVLLPTLVEGQSIGWKTNGLKRQSLPAKLRAYAPEGIAALSYRQEQGAFVAQQRATQGTMRNAMIRYAQIAAVVDTQGILTATAELVLQPGRATTCAVQLPPKSQLLQLIVGDRPVRRDLREDGCWKLPLGPPFLPQRIVVNYRSKLGPLGKSWRLAPPKIFLGDQSLPVPETWWRLRPVQGMQLTKPTRGRRATELQFTQNAYLLLRQMLEDSWSQALELPPQVARAWATTWIALTQQTQQNWQALNLSEIEALEFAAIERVERKFSKTFHQAFAADETSPVYHSRPLAYPPAMPEDSEISPESQEHFFVSNATGQLILPVSGGAQLAWWRWFAAIALVGGTLAALLKLRPHRQWHYDLCHWPHGLSLLGGFAWWLLLRPSVVGMLVMALALLSLAIKHGPSLLQRHRQQRSDSQISVTTS